MQKTLYVADDDAQLGRLIARSTEPLGWRTAICANGSALLSELREGTGPAVVLIDIHMPERDGIETIDGLRDVDRRLRIRFMTGGADHYVVAARLMAEARDLEVAKSLFKPIPLEQLRKTLEDDWQALTGAGD